jgi:DNA-binding response OmpR family regulator
MAIIMLTGHADPAHVFRARDAGVSEFLAKPLSARLLVERLNAVLFNERPFVRAPTYAGPCRRRRSEGVYRGPRRRASDAAPA